jgi:hypothetical protein
MALLPPLPDPLPEPEPDPLPEPLPLVPDPDVDEFDGSITSSHELKNSTAKKMATLANEKVGFNLERRACMVLYFITKQSQYMRTGNTNKFVFTRKDSLLRRIL